ncbi:MAG TPA: 4Fe-4S binding protein [Firmicutes bacterium]|nr:4Fe-4S binding protein [Bacillota bacterium]
MPVDLGVRYVGLDLKSPVIAASAGITGTAERIKRAEDNGAGAVVMKTLFEEPLMAKSPTPRFKVIRRVFAGASSTTLYSYEQGFEYDPDKYFEEIAKAKSSVKIPVIASIGALNEETWVDWAKNCEQAGADALEVNLSCPHGAIVLEKSGKLHTLLPRIARLLSGCISIPVITKMSPQMSDPLAIARSIDGTGAKACVMFSRFPGLDIDIETGKPIMHGGSAGHGGPWAIHYALYWIATSYPHLKIQISGCGGVFHGDDVIKYIMAGATSVQVASAIIVNGYEIIDKINAQVASFMETRGYQRLDEMRGKAVPNILGLRQIDRRKRFKAFIHVDKCSGCALCMRICIYEAVTPDESIDGQRIRHRIMEDKCDGCGLCAELCPTKAIVLKDSTE